MQKVVSCIIQLTYSPEPFLPLFAYTTTIYYAISGKQYVKTQHW